MRATVSARYEVAEIGDAYRLMSPLLGTTLASTLFAVALLLCGLNATVTATLSGQVVMEGFLRFQLPPVTRRLVTRLIAIVPAVLGRLYGLPGAGPDKTTAEGAYDQPYEWPAARIAHAIRRRLFRELREFGGREHPAR